MATELFLDRRIWRKLCPHCRLAHVLDNGRVWGLCGLWKIIRDSHDGPGGVRESEIRRMIRKRFQRQKQTTAT